MGTFWGVLCKFGTSVAHFWTVRLCRALSIYTKKFAPWIFLRFEMSKNWFFRLVRGEKMWIIWGKFEKWEFWPFWQFFGAIFDVKSQWRHSSSSRLCSWKLNITCSLPYSRTFTLMVKNWHILWYLTKIWTNFGQIWLQTWEKSSEFQ